ncbi:hypothetical protein [Gemmata massiliana]|nr:hypothetical protein [Gemmata massiliana]
MRAERGHVRRRLNVPVPDNDSVNGTLSWGQVTSIFDVVDPSP